MAPVVKLPSTHQVIGKSIPRLDADEKVRGQVQYADDIPAPNTWYGAIVRAPVARGRLKKLTFDSSFDWDRVVVVTPEDIPGENIVDLMGRDMPFIAYDEIRYRGEPVALVAAPSKRLAREALEHVHIDIDEEPSIQTLDEVVDRYKREPESLHQLWAQTINKGDVEAALAEADQVVEGEYACGHQEQMYIEPQGMMVTPEKDGSIFIQGSMQCPYYINPELPVTLNLPAEKIRVKQTAVGGAFGGKEEFPTLLAGYCALLAMKAKHPVKMIYDRHQDILYTTKRHPAWTRHTTGLNKDGAIRAMKIEYLLDGGAYTTLSPVVLYRGILHAAMGYRCENVFIDGRVYRTNTFPNGAFRGFGAPQSIWALESHIDKLASACGMTPQAFRRKNCLVAGDTTPTGQVLRKEDTGSPAVLDETLKRCAFDRNYARCSRGNADQEKWYGIGAAFFAHGSGFTGDGEARIKSKVALDLERFENGAPGVNVRVSSTEMGQGTFTILPQATAEGLSVPIDHVRCPHPDTSLVPDSGPTVASRTAMVVGNTLYLAAQDLKGRLEAFASEHLFEGHPAALDKGVFKSAYDESTRPFTEVAEAFLEKNGPVRVNRQFQLSDSIRWNQETFVGDAYPCYAWGCTVAEVEVDPLTLEIKVTKVTATHDIGTVLNPLLAKGQIEGGLVQCLGYALMEKIRVRDGLYDADRMQTYVIPTSMDMPEWDLEFVEFPYADAPPGAKGVGEIPMDGLAAAIANAVEMATGVRLTQLPITPESLFNALEGNAPSFPDSSAMTEHCPPKS